MRESIKLIERERQRQESVEGWDSKNDGKYVNGELAKAASCYAYPGYDTNEEVQSAVKWPWEPKWWKPSPDDRIRELVKAGSLISAEIDRLMEADEYDPWIPFVKGKYPKYQELWEKGNLMVKFDGGDTAYQEEVWPMAIVTHFKSIE